MNKIGAVYVRVSTSEQKEFSPDAQLKAIKEYAKKNNITLDTEFIFKDEGISGRNAENRPEFMKMISLAKSKPKSPFEVILIHKSDRFARNRNDSVIYKSILKKECNVDVISITEDFGDDKFGIIIEAMLEAMAEYYSINLSEEVAKGMKEKATRGEIQSKPPLGYNIKDNKFIPNDKAKIIKMIFVDYNNGLAFKTIATKLNKLNITTKNNNKFDLRGIEYILQNPVYKGYLTYTDGTGKSNLKISKRLKEAKIIKSNDIIPIIDESLYNDVQKRIEKSREKYKYTKPNTQIHWLRRLVKCANCGKTLSFNSGSLRCIGYSHGSCTSSQYISISKIQQLILEDIKKILIDNSIEINITKKSKHNNINEIDIINEKIYELEKMLERAKKLYLEGIDTLDEFKENKIKITLESENLKKELIKLPPIIENSTSKIRIKAKSVYDLLNDNKVDMSIKYDTVHDLIDKVVYNKEGKTLEIFYLN